MRRYFRAGFAAAPVRRGGGGDQPLAASRPGCRPRAGDLEADRELLDAASRHVRGAAHGPDVAAMLATGGQLLVLDGGGWAVARDGSPVAARRLRRRGRRRPAVVVLRRRARRARPSTSTSSRPANDWAVARGARHGAVAVARRPGLRPRRARAARALPAERGLPVRLRAATRADIPALTRLTRRCDESHRDWAGPDLPMPARGGRGARVGAALRPHRRVDPGRRGRATARSPASSRSPRAQVSREDRTPVPGLAHVSAVFVDPAAGAAASPAACSTPPTRRCAPPAIDRAQLWTLEGSPAERLYTALGWARDGRRDVYPPMGLTPSPTSRR